MNLVPRVSRLSALPDPGGGKITDPGNEVVFASQKSSIPSELIWDTNMVDFSSFRDTNMAIVTLHAFALLLG